MTQLNKHKKGTRRGEELGELLSPKLFRALCDPGRLRMLARLACCEEACSVGEIAGCCDVDLSVVSRHLSLLRDAGVLEATRRGRNVYYRVRAAWLAGKLRALADALERCCPRPSQTAVAAGKGARRR